MTDDRRRIDDLIEIMREHDLDALTVRAGEVTYELVRREESGIPATSAESPPVAAVPPSESAASIHVKKVTAPIIGVFYRSPSPGAEPFVEVGDRVSIGQALCILEAMKLMNEITSDYAGVVTRILPQNGQVISLGEEMFWIEP
ncbi:MAG: acetyl-CoA carboxylase biotin carboxyl carrier protein [Candidatus Eremiobacteraeota bacterium]|nr:acetyl-CoA carboxylase biotin carboxyl carrier protein [Candidatus Eremiobacteraeota bacterium]MBV9647799.1 acetyl-CoA carboxylase biotin carboxyl carrier protein [Candidatus Eremiobacteraeota bacterium]